MRALKNMGMAALVLAVGMLVGCDRTFRITVTNVSPVAREVELRDPVFTHPLGTVAPGQSVTKKIKLAEDELPGAFELTAGGMKKPFSLDKKDKDNQYLYIEEKTIVGPLDENKQVKKSDKFQGRSSRTGEPVITGDGDNSAPPKDPKKPGGEVIIEQKPVVD